MVLSAFASELYLKCLLRLETGKVPQTHNLKALFRDLSPALRKQLEELWEAGMPERQKVLDEIRKLPHGEELRTDLQYALDVGADAFREFAILLRDGKKHFSAVRFSQPVAQSHPSTDAPVGDNPYHSTQSLSSLNGDQGAGRRPSPVRFRDNFEGRSCARLRHTRPCFVCRGSPIEF